MSPYEGTYRFVRFHDIWLYEYLGYRICADMRLPHGHYSTIMKWYPSARNFPNSRTS
jgi:hypothetical protein